MSNRNTWKWRQKCGKQLKIENVFDMNKIRIAIIFDSMSMGYLLLQSCSLFTFGLEMTLEALQRETQV